MRISTRLKKLEDAVPRCDGRVTRIVDHTEVLTAADRCRRCGGCHVLVVEEVVVTAETMGAGSDQPHEDQS